jgi:polyhydroxybutyrate depolymerase
MYLVNYVSHKPYRTAVMLCKVFKLEYPFSLMLIIILCGVLTSCESDSESSTVTNTEIPSNAEQVDQNIMDRGTSIESLDMSIETNQIQNKADQSLDLTISDMEEDPYLPPNHDQALAAGTHRNSIVFDTMNREYTLHIPPTINSNEAIPLVLCFHGYTSSATTIMSYSKFNELADLENFIVVYPQGSLFEEDTHWNVGGWTLGSTTDDLGFINHLLDELISIYHIDQQRIYSTGMSNGGYMSFSLACQLSERIAAIASITGSMTPQIYNSCQPQHAMPVLQIHGNEDSVVPYEGNRSWTRSIDDVLGYWNQLNQNTAPPQVTMIEDTNFFDGSTVEHYLYSNEMQRINVEHYKVLGGGHDWPGAWGNKDIEATQLIWEFFQQYNILGRR